MEEGDLPMTNFNEYSTNGVNINSACPASHETFKITYNGLLARNGATEIYVRIGFNGSWSHSRDYQMSRTGQGFEALIELQKGTFTLNICFRDSAGNWDNNSGANYSYDFQPG
jgi:Carbohydrate binding domain (family 25).